MFSIHALPSQAAAPAAVHTTLRLDRSSSGDLSPAQRHGLVAAIVMLHLAAFWGLLQLNVVREALVQAAPVFVSLIAPTAPPQVKPPPLPVPPPPKPQPKVQPAPRPAALIAAPPTAAPAEQAFVVPDTLPPPVVAKLPTPITPAPAAVAEAAPPPPAPRLLPDSAVQYLQAPEVVYPRISMRNGETGLVIVRAYIGTGGGAPHSVQIEKSSAHVRLDQAALAAVQKARFKPYAEKGQPVEGWAVIPIRFELEK